MPLTQAVIDNVANAAIDYHMDRGKVFNQHIQEKPLYQAMRASQQTFPGGKGELTVRPIFETQSTLEGFDSDDTLNFTNPTPIKEAKYPWKMLHLGITMTTDELLRDGVSIVDTNGKNVKMHSQRELTVLANILQVKLDDMTEGWASGFNAMLWNDGTQDAKEVPGIQYFIADDPTTGVVGGIDRATQPLWRNRAFVGNPATLSGIRIDTVKSKLIRFLRQQVRQLRRYGNPDLLILCGSKALDLLESEVGAKGVYTQTGFSGKQELGMGEISVKGLGTFQYDPTLDDLGRDDFMYFIDKKNIKLRPIEGEDMKKHFPARPHDKMVLYRSMTWAGGLTARQLNTSMVVQVFPEV